MAAESPLLRPLGIAAGGLGCFQGLVYAILSLLGILVYSGAIEISTTIPPQEFLAYLDTYISKKNVNDDVIMKPDSILIFISLYFATSVIWIISSGLILHDSYNSKFNSKILIGWVTVTAIVCVLDFAATVTFGVEYSNLKDYVDTHHVPSPGTYLAVPAFMMTLAARGFVLWIINTSLTIYLGLTVKKGITSGRHDNQSSPLHIRRPSVNSTYSTPIMDTYGAQQNAAYQPDPTTAWNIQSPTVGDSWRGPWRFPENNSPRVASESLGSVKMVPRVGRAVSSPMPPPPNLSAFSPTATLPPQPPAATLNPRIPASTLPPLPIPQPDYSPPMKRPVKHEPNLYDAPLRSALKKPTQFGRTIL